MIRTRLLDVAFFGVLGAVMALILTGTLDEVVPGGWARRIAFNSEGYLFALVLGAWIRFGGPSQRRRWPAAVGLAVVCVAIGSFLVATDLPSRIRTLNESFFALGAGVLWVTLPRPIPREILIAPAALAAAVLVAIWSGQDGWAITQAEAIGLVVLLPFALDLVDRGILERDAATSPVLRWAWYLVLPAEIAVVSLLGTGSRQGDGLVAGVLDYLGRVHESVIGILLLHAYFAVGLGRTGRPVSVLRAVSRVGRPGVE